MTARSGAAVATTVGRAREAVIGLDLYLVDAAGQVVVTFPDLPGLTMQQTHYYTEDRERLITTLAAAGMIAVGTRPPDLRQDDTETDAAFADRETARLRDTHGAGITWHKLRGDDAGGWWVTSDECHAALTAHTAAGNPVLDEELIEFLNRAAERGGFRVWTAW